VQIFSSYEYKDDCDMKFLADFHEDNFSFRDDDNHIVGTFDIISDISNSLCNDKVYAPKFDEDPSIFDEYSGHPKDHIFASTHIEFYNSPPLFNESEGSDMEYLEDQFLSFSLEMMGQQEFFQEQSSIVILKGSIEETNIVNLKHQIQESEIEKNKQ
jgi:hypothetical protein